MLQLFDHKILRSLPPLHMLAGKIEELLLVIRLNILKPTTSMKTDGRHPGTAWAVKAFFK